MPYTKSVTKAGETVEIVKSFAGNYGKKWSRREHYQPTPKDVAENNKKYAERKVTNIICENFTSNDWFVTLRFFNETRPDNPQEVLDVGKAFIRKLRKVYKKAGIEFKYVYVTVYFNCKAHYHLVVPNIDTNLIIAAWEYGPIHLTPLYKTSGANDFRKLGEYLIKNTDKQFSRPDSVYKRRYHSSKNLKIPKPKIKIIKAMTWVDEPKPPKGYFIAPPGVENYTCQLTGLPCQYYRLIKATGTDTTKKKPRRLKT